MRKAGVSPDTAHWTAVIRAVGSRKAWARTQFGRVRAMHGLVEALYAQMKEAGCAPNEVSYAGGLCWGQASGLGLRDVRFVCADKLRVSKLGWCLI